MTVDCDEVERFQNNSPSPQKQWEIICFQVENTPLEVKSHWYLISCSWISIWHLFCQDPLTNPSPGPINNQSLINDEIGEFGYVDLRSGLKRGQDFEAVPQSSWNLLLDWYGLENNSKIVARPVVFKEGELKIEVDLLSIMYRINHGTMKEMFLPKDFLVSGLKQIFIQCEDIFMVIEDNEGTDDSNYCFWVSTQGIRKELDDLYNLQTINQAGLLQPNSFLIVNRKVEEATDIEVRKPVNYSPTSGIIGLRNLGNTCFMNSAIQCLSNCEPLTSYFLGDKYMNELNRMSSIGTRGLLAIAYRDLLRQMWDRPETSSAIEQTVNPSKFKLVLGKFESRFLGYQQHDSQEFVSCLLDRLHEDVNRVKVKLYIELGDSDGRVDEVVAQETWDNHKLRNDSVIVDNFHGQFRSMVVCPACGYNSITFDPFEFLSLPLPSSQTDQLEITVVDGINANKLLIPIDSGTAYIEDLLSKVEKVMKDSLKENLIAVEIFNHDVYKIFPRTYLLTGINRSLDDIMVYKTKGKSSVWVTFKISSLTGYSSPVGFPLLITIDDNSNIKDIVENLIKELLNEMGITTLQTLIDEVFEIEEDHSKGIECNFQGFVITLLKSRFIEKCQQDPELLLTKLDLFKGASKSSHLSLNDRNSEVSLQSCLDAFMMPEKLSSDELWYCKKCKTHQAAIKKMDLWRLPKVLIMHLKRFSYTHLWNEKLSTPIQFPVENFCLASLSSGVTSYNLFAVSNHYGGLGGGHYTAFARNFLANKWFNFDDSNVSEGEVDNLYSNESRCSAYLLFYIRRNEQ